MIIIFWLLIHGNEFFAIDPGEADPLIKWLSSKNLRLIGIAITHHHYDHVGGISKLIQNFPNAKVIGPIHDDIQPLHIHAEAEIQFSFWHSKVIKVPGHTKEHVAYYDDKQLFCGDTLFSAGCGRNFECNPDILFDSLETLKSLPDSTKIYCGHEYTKANLKFAQMIEPNHFLINQYNEECKNLKCTLPSNIGLEKKINPFLRCNDPNVVNAVEEQFNCKTTSEKQVFQLLRQWKDSF